MTLRTGTNPRPTRGRPAKKKRKRQRKAMRGKSPLSTNHVSKYKMHFFPPQRLYNSKKTVPFFCCRYQDSAHSPASFPAPPFVHIFAAKSRDMDFSFSSIEPIPNAKSAMSVSSKSTAWRCFYSVQFRDKINFLEKKFVNI